MSPITKSMISRPVALELPGMVGSFAYPAPAKRSLPPRAASRKLAVSSKILPARDARKEKGPFEVATRPVLTPIVVAQSQPQPRKMLDWHAYVSEVEEPRRFATAKGLDLTKMRRVRYDSKCLHPAWVARRQSGVSARG
ncbi:hypothetical protein FIBSPDRAFT_860295 [Athelia psychrophila]|uniref:Uncharacterized protein n=1 Tax=Athelia psychrophila TaxID=1759441 RepID=A0A166K9E9_9AGAM|nr:hypothetical protein FIBSPDRAFT_860288 [Fibularhizoctonia sp. CBS 109695]KZP21669.1 hypothetical protein FIBSPDRAFT_860292 [Fibularhizoctonia sp. CBS 109695]KZP21673.1 hypothetical protein FIBSPDRAFT_860295 [Fibularhizoctonia sp. CBS 109695]